MRFFEVKEQRRVPDRAIDVLGLRNGKRGSRALQGEELDAFN
jgi:hypothetical protein